MSPKRRKDDPGPVCEGCAGEHETKDCPRYRTVNREARRITRQAEAKRRRDNRI